MPVAAHCKLCGERHWSYEGHRYPKDLEVREWAKGFSEPRSVPVVERAVEPEVHVAPVVVSFRADELDDEDENYVLRECEVCKTEFESKRKDARFCSANCRKVASRVKAAKQKDS